MRRSTTFAGTERPVLGLLLVAQLIVAATLVGRWPDATPAAALGVPPAVAPTAVSLAASKTVSLPDGRNVRLLSLGGEHTTPLLNRIAAEAPGAADAVTAFWGGDWPRDIVIAAAATDEQFRALAVGGSDIAAATTAGRIVFAPGAARMSDAALRVVVRHELFHYAAAAGTAAGAPRWLTEGVADFVARPYVAPPAGLAFARLPTDADLDTAGPTRSLAYDRAWWFSRFVADQYGVAALRALYITACGPGHPDPATAVRDTLGVGLDEVLARWGRWTAR